MAFRGLSKSFPKTLSFNNPAVADGAPDAEIKAHLNLPAGEVVYSDWLQFPAGDDITILAIVAGTQAIRVSYELSFTNVLPTPTKITGQRYTAGSNTLASGSFPAGLIGCSLFVGQSATASATLSGGQVTVVTPIIGGSGYVSAPTVTIVGGSGTGAVFTANLSSGIITSFTQVSGGSGYAANVSSVTVVTPGSLYTSNPTVTIDAPPPGGVTATATALVSAGGVIQITVTDTGGGYTSVPNVTISAPGGAGATATATAVLGGFPSVAIESSADPYENEITGIHTLLRPYRGLSGVQAAEVTEGLPAILLGNGSSGVALQQDIGTPSGQYIRLKFQPVWSAGWTTPPPAAFTWRAVHASVSWIVFPD